MFLMSTLINIFKYFVPFSVLEVFSQLKILFVWFFLNQSCFVALIVPVDHVTVSADVT